MDMQPIGDYYKLFYGAERFEDGSDPLIFASERAGRCRFLLLDKTGLHVIEPHKDLTASQINIDMNFNSKFNALVVASALSENDLWAFDLELL